MLISIPAGSQTTFTVTFSPGAVGSRTTTLRVLSDDEDEGISNITLAGTGTGTINPFPLTGMTRLPNGSFQFGFTNQSGLSFTVLASTNVALPMSNWTWMG